MGVEVPLSHSLEPTRPPGPGLGSRGFMSWMTGSGGGGWRDWGDRLDGWNGDVFHVGGTTLVTGPDEKKRWGDLQIEKLYFFLETWVLGEWES